MTEQSPEEIAYLAEIPDDLDEMLTTEDDEAVDGPDEQEELDIPDQDADAEVHA